jgi:hypothetical protein
MSATRPPLEYLVTCSQMSLESVELSRLNHASNLRKEFHQILEEWIDAEVDARLARSILDWKRQQCANVERQTPQISRIAEPVRFEQLPMAFLSDSSVATDCSTAKKLPELRRTVVQANRAAQRGRPQRASRLHVSNRTSPRRDSIQSATAAEARLRELEKVAELLSRRLGEARQFVPVHASCDGLDASPHPPTGAQDLKAVHTSAARRDKLNSRHNRPAGPAPGSMILPAGFSGARVDERHAG